MRMSAAGFDQFMGRANGAVLVDLVETRGSTPRETGAFMLVSSGEIFGTIGGGQLEYLAIDAARRLLRDGQAPVRLDVPLGPEIGQCCGGRVIVGLRVVSAADTADILARLDRIEARMAPVFIMGAGHVGRAIAQALALLPVRATLVDSRAETLEGLDGSVHKKLTALPEAEVRNAPGGSAFVVLTHEHALDFLIAREALLRGDAAYVGMIGSKTKLASFRSWLRAEGEADTLADGLTCPIGGTKVADKRPEVIAALAVSEILVQTALREASKSTGRTAENLGNG